MSIHKNELRDIIYTIYKAYLYIKNYEENP